MNPPVHSCARIETVVQTAVGIEPGNVVAIRAVDSGEQTSDKHLAILLQRDRRNSAWSEKAGQASVGGKLAHEVIPSDEHRPIRLQRDRTHMATTRIETAVQT